ncbi:DUF2125 domain-containing protein [Mesorhizobium sp. RP14(2022)]|uniref:DUF2125 domain-containing protein n=1 Tax=Mesorhizobium liriopis TaxID=2953882 RepID=A0ABT1CA46_9HYPH|nr:DUF2125 domain-containing protein [Mesorhizobium liriopis]MCO6051667.1 DUF2125 domain-containing protein [Mesorhizobium liriopis]
MTAGNAWERYERDRPNYARRIFWLGFAVVVVIALYAGGWFWLANRLEGEAQKVVTDTQSRCDNLRAAGFPFRMGLFCDATAWKQNGVEVSAGALRSAAQIYDPTLIVGEIDGPAKVAVPGLPPLDVNWEVLKASAKLAEPVPTRASTEARKVQVTGPSGAILSADSAQSHMRVRDADLDFAANFSKLTLAGDLAPGGTLPALDGEAEATLTGAANRFTGSLRGQSGTLTKFQISDGTSAALQLSGPFSVNDEGLLSGQFAISLKNTAQLARILSQALPGLGDRIAPVLASIGEVSNVPLTVRDGRASILFFELGRVPPLH